MKKIYKVEHWCGWGPYDAAFFESYGGAEKFFHELLSDIRKKEEYIPASMDMNSKIFLHADQADQKEKVLRKATWKVEKETNNESGHEFWEEDEWLDIREVELKP